MSVGKRIKDRFYDFTLLISFQISSSTYKLVFFCMIILLSAFLPASLKT